MSTGIEQVQAGPSTAVWPLHLVLSLLAERLEAALGQDPWALGHRAAAFAIASRLVDEDGLDDLITAGPAAPDHEVALLLRGYLDNPRDTRGFPTT